MEAPAEVKSIAGMHFSQGFNSPQHGRRSYTFLLGADPGVNDDFVIIRTYAALDENQNPTLCDQEMEHHSLAIPADIFLQFAEWMGAVALPVVKNLTVIEFDDVLYGVLEWSNHVEEVLEFPSDVMTGEEVGDFIRAYLGV